MHAVHIQSNILESIDVMNQQRNDGSYKTSAQLTMYLYTYIFERKRPADPHRTKPYQNKSCNWTKMH